MIRTNSQPTKASFLQPIMMSQPLVFQRTILDSRIVTENCIPQSSSKQQEHTFPQLGLPSPPSGSQSQSLYPSLSLETFSAPGGMWKLGSVSSGAPGVMGARKQRKSGALGISKGAHMARSHETQDSEGDMLVGCQIRMMGEMLQTSRVGRRCFHHSLSLSQMSDLEYFSSPSQVIFIPVPSLSSFLVTFTSTSLQSHALKSYPKSCCHPELFHI